MHCIAFQNRLPGFVRCVLGYNSGVNLLSISHDFRCFFLQNSQDSKNLAKRIDPAKLFFLSSSILDERSFVFFIVSLFLSGNFVMTFCTFLYRCGRLMFVYERFGTPKGLFGLRKRFTDQRKIPNFSYRVTTFSPTNVGR